MKLEYVAIGAIITGGALWALTLKQMARNEQKHWHVK